MWSGATELELPRIAIERQEKEAIDREYRLQQQELREVCTLHRVEGRHHGG